MAQQFIQSFASGKVLDVEGNQNCAGANVIAYQKKLPASANQLWRLEPIGDGSFWVTSAINQNLVLDVEGGHNAPGARLIVWDRKFPPAPNQLFYWDENMLASLMNPALVVDVDGGNSKSIILWSKHGGWNQRWLVQNPY